MKASQQNLECADVILERHRLPPDPWRDLRRDIALTIDMAEQAAASNMKDVLIKRVREGLSGYDLEQFILKPRGKGAVTFQLVMDDLVTELEAIDLSQHQETEKGK